MNNMTSREIIERFIEDYKENFEGRNKWVFWEGEIARDYLLAFTQYPIDRLKFDFAQYGYQFKRVLYREETYFEISWESKNEGTKTL